MPWTTKSGSSAEREIDGSLLSGAGGDRLLHAAGGIGLVLILIGFVVYDVLWKAIKNETAGAVISFVLVGVFAFVLTRVACRS